MTHSFHIPVLGLAFSIDTPIKVAKFGISSVVSIVDDELVERMRKYYSEKHDKGYLPISAKDSDFRARRITAYLDLMYDIVHNQIITLKSSTIKGNAELQKYFNLLPDHSHVKNMYELYKAEEDTERKKNLEYTLKMSIQPGDIHVNIMSKVDKINYDNKGNTLDLMYSDATAALRGFAMSKLNSAVVLSAGMNPRLYSYLSELPQFLPDSQSNFLKKIILKVSDYRSALIQAKFLAKKGIWISEFRVESGLNCGGHAFATDGYLLGPILEEFRVNREHLKKELFGIYQTALQEKNIYLQAIPELKITAQGGIGTHEEHQFLLDHYKLDSTGWGSPFLLVPEATTVDDQTLKALADAKREDFYISNSSPLGVPFNNFRRSAAEENRLARIQKGRPGAACSKKYLVSNDEYTDQPVCTASRVYQYTKLKELEIQDLDPITFQKESTKITEKTCLCEGLAAAAYLKYNITDKKDNTAVAICPGPNTAYFNSIYTLQNMVDHIYGRKNLLEKSNRSSFFINELQLYVEHLEKYITTITAENIDKSSKYLDKFISQLFSGIAYYQDIAADLFKSSITELEKFNFQLDLLKTKIETLPLPVKKEMQP